MSREVEREAVLRIVAAFSRRENAHLHLASDIHDCTNRILAALDRVRPHLPHCTLCGLNGGDALATYASAHTSTWFYCDSHAPHDAIPLAAQPLLPASAPAEHLDLLRAAYGAIWVLSEDHVPDCACETCHVLDRLALAITAERPASGAYEPFDTWPEPNPRTQPVVEDAGERDTQTFYGAEHMRGRAARSHTDESEPRPDWLESQVAERLFNDETCGDRGAFIPVAREVIELVRAAEPRQQVASEPPIQAVLRQLPFVVRSAMTVEDADAARAWIRDTLSPLPRPENALRKEQDLNTSADARERDIVGELREAKTGFRDGFKGQLPSGQPITIRSTLAIDLMERAANEIECLRGQADTRDYLHRVSVLSDRVTELEAELSNLINAEGTTCHQGGDDMHVCLMHHFDWPCPVKRAVNVLKRGAAIDAAMKADAANA